MFDAFRPNPPLAAVISRIRLCVTVTAALLLCAGCQSSPEPEPDPQPPSDAEESSTAGELYQQADPGSESTQSPSDTDDEDGPETEDERLAWFADAVRALQDREQQLVDRGETLEERTAEAESPAEVRRAQQEYLAEMEDAVEQTGMTMPEFMDLGQQIRDNPELREQLTEHIDEARLEEFFGD